MLSFFTENPNLSPLVEWRVVLQEIHKRAPEIKVSKGVTQFILLKSFALLSMSQVGMNAQGRMLKISAVTRNSVGEYDLSDGTTSEVQTNMDGLPSLTCNGALRTSWLTDLY